MIKYCLSRVYVVSCVSALNSSECSGRLLDKFDYLTIKSLPKHTHTLTLKTVLENFVRVSLNVVPGDDHVLAGEAHHPQEGGHHQPVPREVREPVLWIRVLTKSRALYNERWEIIKYHFTSLSSNFLFGFQTFGVGCPKSSKLGRIRSEWTREHVNKKCPLVDIVYGGGWTKFNEKDLVAVKVIS